MVISGTTLKTKFSDIVTPFVPQKEIAHGMSYGLSLAGYDIRIAQDVELVRGYMQLASSLERFKMPNNVIGEVKDKSSWIRQGVFNGNTVIEPGWEGWLTLELVNHSPKETSIWIKAGTPIAQILFKYTDVPTIGYTGKYQDQENKPVPFVYETVKSEGP